MTELKAESLVYQIKIVVKRVVYLEFNYCCTSSEVYCVTLGNFMITHFDISF